MGGGLEKVDPRGVEQREGGSEENCNPCQSNKTEKGGENPGIGDCREGIGRVSVGLGYDPPFVGHPLDSFAENCKGDKDKWPTI